MIFGIFVIIAVWTTASATKKGADSPLTVPSKERQELKELLRHDNKELREQDTKLQREDDQLRKRVEELQEQNVKLREEKLHDEIAMMKKEIKKLHDENAQLKKQNTKLRHVDRRQRDQIDNLALEQKIKDVVRLEDVALETKKREAQDNNSSMMRDAITEVEIIGGSASATSVYADRYKPNYAFIRGNARAGWLSKADPKNRGIYPQMVWYDFGQGNAFVPARVSFRGRTDVKDYQREVPAVWEFVGSNDDVCSGSGNWTILCQDLSDVIPQDMMETKFCDVSHGNPSMQQREYRCLGINVIRAHYHAGFTGLSNLRMWKNVSQTGGMKNATQLE